MRYQHQSRLPILRYTRDSHRKSTLVVGPALVLCVKGVVLTYSHLPSYIPKIILTPGCPALPRTSLFLFYLSISRFVISIKYFFNKSPCFPLCPCLKKIKVYFSKLNVMELFSTLFSLFVSLFYCSLACTSSLLSRRIPFPTAS